MRASDKSEDREAAQELKVAWPNRASYGTHINVSGGGVTAHAKNKGRGD
jgi:iron(III) transport system substrate-binding protein